MAAMIRSKIEKNNQLVLVIKDDLDIRNIIDHRNTFCLLVADRDLIVYASQKQEVIDSALFFLIEVSRSFIFFTLPESSLKAKFGAWCKRSVYYLRTYRKSVSSRQKLLELMKLPSSICFSSLVASIPNISDTITNSCSDVRNISVEGLNSNKSLIIFMRSDASQNEVVFGAYKSYVSVNVIRNVDTLYTKGPFVVNSKVAINLWGSFIGESKFTEFGVRSVLNVAPPYLDVLKNANGKTNVRPKVLYATSHPRFVPDESAIVSELYQKLSKRFDVYIKIHDADNIDNYKNIPINTYTYGNLRKLGAHKEERYTHLNELAGFGVVIATTSTFLIDARSAGVDKLFFINDSKFVRYDSLYLREHLKILKDKLPANFISNLEEFDYDAL